MKKLIFSGLTMILLISCSQSEKEKIDTQSEEAMYMKEDENVESSTREQTNWEEVDVTSPIVSYEEIQSEEIEVRGTKDYSVYAVDETILFDFDKSSIREGGEEKLEEVITSVKKRHPDGEIAVRGYTDAIGSKDYNKELAEKRADAVASFLEDDAGIEDDQVTVLAKGEQDPVASNETVEGRQKNRRVEILVRN